MAKRKFDIGDTVYYIFKGKRYKSIITNIHGFYDGYRKTIKYSVRNNRTKKYIKVSGLRMAYIVLVEKRISVLQKKGKGSFQYTGVRNRLGNNIALLMGEMDLLMEE